MDETRLRDRILELAPWHLKVDVASGVDTSIAAHAASDKASGPVSFLDTEVKFKRLVESVYPDGLEGKRFLDVACNCGAYSFWANELGAAECLGFDARRHWLDQAEFLLEHRSTRASGTLSFHLSDLYDLPALVTDRFDVTMFEGILYHLPDPINALKLVAERTEELLIVNTAMRRSVREGLVLAREKEHLLMNGVDSLNWYPTSPRVVQDILRLHGFEHFRILYHRRIPAFNRQRGIAAWLKAISLGTMRLHMLAARSASTFADFDRSSGRRIVPSASLPTPSVQRT